MKNSINTKSTDVNPVKMMGGVMGIMMAATLMQSFGSASPTQTKYTLNVVSNPPGASMWLEQLDGTQINSTPYTTPQTLQIDPGTFIIRITKDGYNVYTKQITSVAGQTATLTANLTSVNAELDVSSTPSGASVSVDGAVPAFITPCTIILIPGVHSIVISKTGYNSYSTSSNFETGRIYGLSPILSAEQQNGQIDIVSDPSGAEIWINGTDQSRVTPNSFIGPPQTLYLTLKKDGYDAWTQQIAVVSGQTTPISATLTPTAAVQTFIAPDGTVFTSFVDWLNYMADHYGSININW